ncbi:MAG: radical SAM family heme chaperone HemW [Akkermansia sp.]
MHLYVHIPFCHRICPYCAFYKHTPGATDMRRFIEALLIEAQSRNTLLKTQQETKEERTLFFGGGTPSMLSTTHLTRLVEGLDTLINVASLDEFSFESNPATFTPKKVNHWKSLGITRVSLGIQSWEPHILQILGREHTPQQAENDIAILRQAGIPEINIDLMFSIPGQSLTDWEQTLRHTLALHPDHISAYNLTYEEDTAFFKQLQQGGRVPNPDDDANYFTLAHEMITQQGFRHYETSNYAQQDKLSRHNMGYWLGHDYIGIGPGAVSTLNNQRIQNTPDTEAYIESTLKNGLPASTIEHLSPDNLHLERVALLLRTDQGTPLSILPSSGQPIIQGILDEKMARLTTVNGEKCITLTGRGILMVDEIVTSLFAHEP